MSECLKNRIRERLAATGKTPRSASIQGGLNGDTISKILGSSKKSSPTLNTVEKMARGLETTPEWLAYGLEVSSSGISNSTSLLVDRDVLRQAVRFVLEKAGASEEEAELVAHIFPEALSGPAVDVVDRDPFLSFQVHLQLEAGRS